MKKIETSIEMETLQTPQQGKAVKGEKRLVNLLIETWIAKNIVYKQFFDLVFNVYCDFRGGSRRAFRKRRTSRTDDQQTTHTERMPLQNIPTAVEGDTPSDDVENKMPKDTERGWSSILFAVFKILTLGIAVFIYDIYSK